MENETWVSKLLTELVHGDIYKLPLDGSSKRYMLINDCLKEHIKIDTDDDITCTSLSDTKYNPDFIPSVLVLDKRGSKHTNKDTQDVGAILDRVKTTLVERGKQYDKDSSQERSMAKTVSLFNQLTGSDLTELQGWQFMEILKLVRYWENPETNHEDSLIDGIGYSALKAECALNKKE